MSARFRLALGQSILQSQRLGIDPHTGWSAFLYRLRDRSGNPSWSGSAEAGFAASTTLRSRERTRALLCRILEGKNPRIIRAGQINASPAKLLARKTFQDKYEKNIHVLYAPCSRTRCLLFVACSLQRWSGSKRNSKFDGCRNPSNTLL